MTGRLEKTPDEVVRRLIIEPGLEKDLEAHFDFFLEVNAAHLVMLADTGIITAETAGRLARALETIRDAGPGRLPIDPSLEDLFFNIEAELIRLAGQETGGQLHTARSRNDMLATVARMRMRRELAAAGERLVSLRRSLHTIAAGHLDHVMSGYTHLQGAEPITVAHYLAAALHALERDHRRLAAALDGADEGPLGSGAMASTTFAIDRALTARLLGFPSSMGNSLDGVASRDYMLEALGTLAIMTSNLGRFAQDLYIWATDEFGYVEVDASVAVTSSIMPQKKNPVTLEHIKAKSAHLQACWVSAQGALKSSAYSHSRESSVEALRFVWDGVTEASTALELFEHTLENITFNTTAMGARAATNFSCVTELANVMVRSHGISFRTAHHLVGALVAHCLDHRLTAQDIDADMIANISLRFLPQALVVSPTDLDSALDPTRNVAHRTTHGGPAPAEVHRQLDRLTAQLAEDEKNLTARTEHWKEARHELAYRMMALDER
ncbi:argininosuccinate lyase [Glutamicibacter sp. AOP12-B1-11]|uniref:argininosuccinate lyase n=1 Tax=Glutamicibacter sp. AOP12-B1-11 TaxID=3457725 RepID=UPI004034796D